MKKCLVTLLILCGLQLFVLAQASNQSDAKSKSSATEEEVLRLHKEFLLAGINHDTKAAERLLAADFFANTNNGQTLDKATVIDQTQKDDTKVDLKEEGLKMHLYDNTAIVTYKMVGVAYPNGKEMKMNVRVVEVWVKRKSTWQLTFTQSNNEK